MPSEIPIISDEDLKAPLELAKNYEKLAKEFDDVAATTAKLAAQIAEQDATMANLNKQTKTLEKEVSKLEKAQKKSEKSQKSYAAATELADKATGGMVSGAKALGKQFLLLLANPIVAMFAALGVAVAAVVTYFKSSAEGGDKLEKIMAGLKGVLNFLVKQFAAVGEQIVKMFEDGNVVGELFTGIFFGVVQAISTAIKAFGAIIKTINILAKYNLKDILTGNFSKADAAEMSKSFEEVGDSFIAIFTGAGEAAEAAKKIIESMAAITAKNQEIGNRVAAKILTNAEAQLKVEKLMFIAKDKQNHTDQERLAAAQQAIAIQEKELKGEQDIAKAKELTHTATLAMDKGVISSNEEAQKILTNGLTIEQEKLLAAKLNTDETTALNTLKAASIEAEKSFWVEQQSNLKLVAGIKKEMAEAEWAMSEKLRMQRIRSVEDEIAAIRKKEEVIKGSNEKEFQNYADTTEGKEKMNEGFLGRLKESQKKHSEDVKVMNKNDAEEEMQRKQEEEDVKNAIEGASIQVVEQLGNEFFNRKQEKLAQESANLEAKRQEELKAAGDDERKKLAINRKFDAEQKKIKTKQAQAEKQQAMFNILINTAVGVMKAAPVVPLMIITAALGAFQLAMVAAKPIPKFATGTLNAPDTFIAGERGRELVSHNGQGMLVDRPTMFSGLGGAQVFSNSDTEDLLSVGPALIYGSRLRKQIAHRDRVVDTLSENNKWLKKIALKPEVDLYVDEEGFHQYSNRVAKRNARLNRRFYGT